MGSGIERATPPAGSIRERDGVNGMRNCGQRFNVFSLRKQGLAMALALAIGLFLQSADLRAELFFRGVEQVNGQQRWSAIKRYASPADTVYPRVQPGAAEEVRVFLSGAITRADLDGATVLMTLLKSGKQKVAGNTVWLASNGGDIDTGMELGRLLRKAGIYTFVGKNDQCMSACVFAFMGGERRGVAGRLGIHRPFFPFTQESPDRPARFRHLQKTLKDYVEEMDFPASLYEAVMLVPPETMQILTAADLKRFYLEGISPSSEDLADAAAARRLELSMGQYLQRKAKLPACTFAVTGCDGRVQDSTASGSAPDAPGQLDRTESAAVDRRAGPDAGGSQGAGTGRGKVRGGPSKRQSGLTPG